MLDVDRAIRDKGRRHHFHVPHERSQAESWPMVPDQRQHPALLHPRRDHGMHD